MFKIPYGVSNFERIRTNGFLYVDKTHFIEKIETIDCLMYLRPRRFGKSLFLSMLDRYYDIASAGQFDQLFKGLYIYEHSTEHRNNYYMLRFNFSGIQNTEMEGLEEGFVGKVKDGAQRFINRYKLDIEMPKESSAAAILKTLLAGFVSLDYQIIFIF